MALTGTARGVNTTTNLTNGIIKDVDELIWMLDPTETPLLTGQNYNGLPGALIPVGAPAEQIKVEWQEENILLPYAASTSTIASGVTTLVVGAEHQSKFQIGDVCSTPSGELIQVTAYVSTDSLTITRGFASTSAATITSGDIIRSIGPVLTEGSDPGTSRVADRALLYNYTQIFGPSKLSLSATAQQIRRYGVPDEFAHQLANRVAEHALYREQAMLMGSRYQSSGIRAMGGIDYFIGANGTTDSSSTSLTASVLSTNMATAWGLGGVPTHLILRPERLATIDDLTNTSVVRQTVVEGARGRQPVTVVMTEYGDVQVVRNRYVSLARAYLVMLDGRINRRILRAQTIEPLAKTGDADHVQMVGEETLEVKGSSQMVRFTALTS